MIPQDFLKYIAKEHSVSNTELDVLSAALNGEPMNAIATRLGIRPEAARKRLGEVYKKFHIAGAGPGKLAKLQQILVSQYQNHQAQGILTTPVEAPSNEDELEVNRRDWGEAPDASVFYGRQSDLDTLATWLVQDHCRLVALLGIGGIGKTALSVRLAKQFEASEEFDFIIWRSLRHGTTARDTIGRLIQLISRQRRIYLPDATNERISLLLEYLRRHRCLIVFDNMEAVLKQGDLAGQYRDGYEDYGEFLRRIGEEAHTSCVLLTSTEKPREIALLEGNDLPVRALQLAALDVEEAYKIFQAKGLDEKKLWGQLIDLYRGNPLTLKIVSTTIQELFGGKVSEFLKQTTLVFGDIRDFLQRQFDRLSELEKTIMYWLALEHRPISLEILRDNILVPFPQPELLEALESLGRRSLIERSAEVGRALFTLQPVVMEYVIQDLIENVGLELQELLRTQKIERVNLFRSHLLARPDADEEEERETNALIRQPIEDRLRKIFRNDHHIEMQLERLCLTLQNKFPLEVGYAFENTEYLLEGVRERIEEYEEIAEEED